MLSAIANTERALFDTLPGEHQNHYYDMKVRYAVRENRRLPTTNH